MAGVKFTIYNNTGTGNKFLKATWTLPEARAVMKEEAEKLFAQAGGKSIDVQEEKAIVYDSDGDVLGQFTIVEEETY